MKLSTPCKSIDFRTKDIDGNVIRLADYRGKKVILSFFRDAACPFCNLRLYELTQKYPSLQASNIEVIAVFSSNAEQVREFVARHPRPFVMLSDPELQLYQRYGIEHSASAIVKALLLRLPRIIRGFLKGGTGDIKNPHVTLVPADFLITEQGDLKTAWYGRNTSDHIPMEAIRKFADAKTPSGRFRK